MENRPGPRKSHPVEIKKKGFSFNVGRTANGKFKSLNKRRHIAVSIGQELPEEEALIVTKQKEEASTVTKHNAKRSDNVITTLINQLEGASSQASTRKEKKLLNRVKGLINKEENSDDDASDRENNSTSNKRDKDDDYMVETSNPHRIYHRTLPKMKEIVDAFDNKLYSYKALARRYSLPEHSNTGYQLIERFRTMVQEKRENRIVVQKKINESTLETFRYKDRMCHTMNGRSVQTMALRHSYRLNNKTFKASRYWIHCFKKANNIGSRHVDKIVAKKTLDNAEDVNNSISDFKSNVARYIRGKYDTSKIFNVDQVPLKEELHCNRTLTFRGAKTVTRQVQRENASTHSLTMNPVICADGSLPERLFIVLREPKLPQCFDQQVAVYQDLRVYHSESGMMSKFIIKKWMIKEFLPACDDNSIILLDSWPGFRCLEQLPEVSNKHLEIVTFAAKTTSALQPLDLIFNRSLKDFIRTGSELIRTQNVDFPIGKRTNLIALLNLTWNQFKCGRYQEFVKECFWKAGLLATHPKNYETPGHFCFKNAAMCTSKCANDTNCFAEIFIRCSYCSKYYCFDHAVNHRH